MEDLEMHEHQMENTMKEWGARLDGLKARADKASADVRVELHKQAGELMKLQASAQKHLEEVKASSKDTWKDVRKDVEERWAAISASFESLWAKVKS